MEKSGVNWYPYGRKLEKRQDGKVGRKLATGWSQVRKTPGWKSLA
jgi:hypothetical protein